jgi:hypothetical protein
MASKGKGGVPVKKTVGDYPKGSGRKPPTNKGAPPVAKVVEHAPARAGGGSITGMTKTDAQGRTATKRIGC